MPTATAYNAFLPSFQVGADMMSTVLQSRLAEQRHQDQVRLEEKKLVMDQRAQDELIAQRQAQTALLARKMAQEALGQKLFAEGIQDYRASVPEGEEPTTPERAAEINLGAIRAGIERAMPTMGLPEVIDFYQRGVVSQDQVARWAADIRQKQAESEQRERIARETNATRIQAAQIRAETAPRTGTSAIERLAATLPPEKRQEFIENYLDKVSGGLKPSLSITQLTAARKLLSEDPNANAAMISEIDGKIRSRLSEDSARKGTPAGVTKAPVSPRFRYDPKSGKVIEVK